VRPGPDESLTAARYTPRMAARRHAGAIVTALTLAMSACGDGVTPSLQDFRFDGPASDSASVLLLSTGFVDPDGDLAGGSLETFIDQRPTSAGALPLLPIFLASDVPENATEGRLRFVLELNVATQGVPPVGTTFRLGIRATDSEQNSSSTSEIGLTLTSD